MRGTIHSSQKAQGVNHHKYRGSLDTNRSMSNRTRGPPTIQNEIIWQIILSSQNLHMQKAIQEAIKTIIHKPSTALRSPYVQVNTDELKKLS
ncbi:hypothetical protein PIB30_034266 [Stylosanthes scabra]|uniref:Uncharacterized protein n=1 Tax=Stylosanthes scabra TaxID=79078 RepID=A0ABU6XDJ5_9FABA|nr:hypothetical protein [Stylosanthes scabra]